MTALPNETVKVGDLVLLPPPEDKHLCLVEERGIDGICAIYSFRCLRRERVDRRAKLASADPEEAATLAMMANRLG